jgi:ABC-type multidrug transport system permease subunit
MNDWRLTMDAQTATILATTLIFLAVLFGFFKTKTEGFGKYTTATLLLVLVLFISSIAFFKGLVDSSSFMNVLAAVAGFAGGLFTAKEA